MYPTGWKFTELKSATTTALTEFATELQAPEDLRIMCEGFTWCLFTLGHNATSAGFSVDVWGTQTDGEAGQNMKFCFNSRLFRFSGDANYAGGMSSVTIPGTTITEMCELDTPTGQDSGANESGGSANPIDAVHYWNRLAGNQTVAGYMDASDSPPDARSADDPDFENLWWYPAIKDTADTGPSWVCAPCGPFNFLQLEIAAATNPAHIFYNLIQ